MASAASKITLSPSRDIPFNKLVLSQANVRRVKTGVSIEALAEDIARRTLLQSLNVRPVLDDSGAETGMFEVPAGGRRFRALELLVKQKRMAKVQPVPCVVREAGDISAEEDSLAENTHREQLHPLDQFRGMQVLAEQGMGIEAIAAHFMVTPAVVRQRLKLAAVSPRLHGIYADDGMSLDHLMAFSVSDDHARQEQVWEMLEHSFNRSPAWIRQRLTEDTVRAADRRVRFVGLDTYVAAGGGVIRDLFEEDGGGWLTDPLLLDRMVGERLAAEGERIRAEGWKWVETAIDFPYGHTHGLREIAGTPVEPTEDEQARIAELQAEAEAIEDSYAGSDDVPDEVEARINAIDEELAGLVQRPFSYVPEEKARAGVFVSLDIYGTLHVQCGFVRSADEPAPKVKADTGDAQSMDEHNNGSCRMPPTGADGQPNDTPTDDDAEEDVIRPLPDRLVSELTAERTLALQDAFARSPSVAFTTVLHALVLSTFYFASRESCLGFALQQVSFPNQGPGLKDSPASLSIAERHARWKERLPKADRELWDALATLDGQEQAELFAHCAAFGVNALWEAVPRYDNGRISAHTVERRIAHSHVLARATGLDMVTAGWMPTVENYLGRVTKPRILEAVTEAKGADTASLIDHLKKGDMAREAERLLTETGWLPEPLRTPVIEQPTFNQAAYVETDLPAFLVDQPAPFDPDDDGYGDHHAIAAE